MSRTRTITLTLGSIAAGAVLATGLTGIAVADDNAGPASSSATASASTDSTAGATSRARGGADGRHHGGPGQPGGHGPMGGAHGGPRGEVLHSEAVVQAEDGTLATIRMVEGEVTAVSATSITVRAEDGYTGTFAVDSATAVHTGLPQRGVGPTTGSIADVAVGDVARVRGTVTGGTATAEHVHAMTAAEHAQLEQLRADRSSATTAPGSTTQG